MDKWPGVSNIMVFKKQSTKELKGTKEYSLKI